MKSGPRKKTRGEWVDTSHKSQDNPRGTKKSISSIIGPHIAETPGKVQANRQKKPSHVKMMRKGRASYRQDAPFPRSMTKGLQKVHRPNVLTHKQERRDKESTSLGGQKIYFSDPASRPGVRGEKIVIDFRRDKVYIILYRPTYTEFPPTIGPVRHD